MSKRILLFTCLVLLSVLSFAQTRVVKGKVTDENGTVLPGVSVLQKGSKKGTQTDQDGTFTITITGNVNDLVFSSIGYKRLLENISGKENVTVTLQKDVTSGEEVVVVGYTTVKRKDLTGSVSSVSGKEFKDIPISSAAEVLQGRLAGVQAISSEGGPNADIVIRVRGGGSITQDNNPLYIVDGVQVENALSI
ncbi:MAG: carboxypeptidase-like regulatory domain-containing protein, partial [Ferruginibacter sp.]